jgi:GT2 family glycosyltransferase
MMPIHIITVSDGNINSLKITLQSIDNQDFKEFKNLIITKKKFRDLDKKFKTSKRSIFYKKNSSIYGAMNYGIKKSKNNSIIFLNSGDTFVTKSSLKKIAKYNNKAKTCLMFVSILKNNNDYFIPKKKVFFSKKFLTHSSFVRPINKKDLGFNENNKITADGMWMKNNIEKYSINKIYSSLTVFYLGGISNLPSKRSIQMKINTGLISISKEIIKFLLLKLVGKNIFYKLIYHFKYDRINYNKINK